MKHNIRRYNQHFINDESVLEDLVLNSDIANDDTVLEIGPGNGLITAKLLKAAKKVIVIEYDKRMEIFLGQLKEKYPNLEVKYGNALTINFPKIDVIVSNIPFNITEPLLSRLFSEKFRAATLLVGETYGRQATNANPNSRIGLLTRAYFEAHYIKDVPSKCFDPEPSTNGSIITLYPVKKSELKDDFKRYMIRCIWDQKTKLLKDALSSAIFQYIDAKSSKTSSPRPFLEQINKKYDLPLQARVDKLINSEFLGLYDMLDKINLKKCFGGHKPRGGARNWRIDYAEYI